jgi:hypothetical protein
MKEIIRIIDNNTFQFYCEKDAEGEYLDTKVMLNGILFCWITFVYIDKFMQDFSDFISKYRI